jgi:hypothetical protein
MSSNISFLSSPNPGARIATTLTILLNLFKIRVDRASFSISVAIIKRGRFVFLICSKIGNNSCCTNVIFFICY